MSDDGFNFDEFLKFANDFNKTLQEENFIMDVMNYLGNVMIRDVKMRTPVGQYSNKVFFVKGGKLLVFEADKGSGRAGGELRRNWILNGVQKVGDEFVVTISNNTEYASYVENGHRTADHSGWVEGQFFLKITMDEIQEKLPSIVGPAYKSYLGAFGFKE
ncbi:HK97 gp10 family phage protein [Enterococcus timonensis]|uniref:HK97 gp10 family phage protein n=1 Tax=Enterococcus timonensis TaxID=1852364 RepID=UPI0008DA6716|nr:HK97 gp10 family phage protein [Enterococcus timonensis]